MSSLFSKPKAAPVIEQDDPVVVDNSDKIQEEEKRRKKRYSVSSTLLAGNDDISSDNTVKKIVRSEKRKLTRDFIILVFAGVLMFFAGIYLGYAAKGTGFWPYRKLFPAEAAKQEAQLERERYFDKLNADGQFVAEDGKTYTYYVIIDGEEISFCGQKYADTAALRAELEKVKRANTVMVFDDFAVSSIYHDVTELLSELGIDYEETK